MRNSGRGVVMCVFVKRVSMCGLASLGVVSPCIISRTSQLKGWKQHQVVCEPISQLGTERKEKIHKTGIYNTILTLSERD